MNPLAVAVDAMGGDHAPDAVIAGALRAHEAGIPVILVGDRERLGSCGLPVEHASDVVPMGGAAVDVRRLPGASIRRAMSLVAEGRAGSVVSCGSSGATLVSAVLDLGMVEGIDRPALIASLPRADGGALYVCDVGATVDCRPTHLVQFALLGASWASAMGVTDPAVGLLSNGAEAQKGNRLVKETLPMLEAMALRFVGPIEPHEALAGGMGGVDVLVTDGFTGNVLLKTAEGVVTMIRAAFQHEVERSADARAALPDLRVALESLRHRLDWRGRGGGVLVGARAPVIIGHGRADAAAIDAAIRLAHYACARMLTDDLSRRVASALSSSEDAKAGEGG